MLWFCPFHGRISCLYEDFECFKLALWPTLRQKFMHFWSFLTRPGDKHDEGISNCSSTPQAGLSSWFSWFCLASLDVLTVLTTRLLIPWFLGKYEEFPWLNKNGNVDCCLIVIDLLRLTQRIASFTTSSPRDFATVLRDTWYCFVGHMFFKCDEISQSTAFTVKIILFFLKYIFPDFHWQKF